MVSPIGLDSNTNVQNENPTRLIFDGEQMRPIFISSFQHLVLEPQTKTNNRCVQPQLWCIRIEEDHPIRGKKKSCVVDEQQKWVLAMAQQHVIFPNPIQNRGQHLAYRHQNKRVSSTICCFIFALLQHFGWPTPLQIIWKISTTKRYCPFQPRIFYGKIAKISKNQFEPTCVCVRTKWKQTFLILIFKRENWMLPTWGRFGGGADVSISGTTYLRTWIYAKRNLRNFHTLSINMFLSETIFLIKVVVSWNI